MEELHRQLKGLPLDPGYFRGEAGASLVGPIRMEGHWSTAVRTCTHGVQSTRVYALHQLLFVEEDNEKERNLEREHQAQRKREKDEYAALPEFLRRQIAPPKSPETGQKRELDSPPEMSDGEFGEGGGWGQLQQLPSTTEGAHMTYPEGGAIAYESLSKDTFSRQPSVSFPRSKSGSYEAKHNWKIAGHAMKTGTFSSGNSAVSGTISANSAAAPQMKPQKEWMENGILKEVPGTGQIFKELNWKKVRTRQARLAFDSLMRHRRGDAPPTALSFAADPTGPSGHAAKIWINKEFEVDTVGSGDLLSALEVEYWLEMMGCTMPMDQIERLMAEWGTSDGAYIDFAGVCWMLGPFISVFFCRKRNFSLVQKRSCRFDGRLRFFPFLVA